MGINRLAMKKKQISLVKKKNEVNRPEQGQNCHHSFVART
jgi:hypothetical protein